MKSIEVKYFALFREKAGLDIEKITSTAATLKELYLELSARHGFNLPWEMVQVAVNDEFSSLHSPLLENSRIVFIPPVAGG
jgi:molybdopterin synthase sulfur carrier subunit